MCGYLGGGYFQGQELYRGQEDVLLYDCSPAIIQQVTNDLDDLVLGAYDIFLHENRCYVCSVGGDKLPNTMDDLCALAFE